MRRAIASLFVLTATHAALAQAVAGDVKAIGFSAGSQTRFVYRQGQWTPVVVELTPQTSRPFQGSLRVERPDLDGDLVEFSERPIVLTPDQGIRRAWCYFVAFPDTTQQALTVDVLGDDGALVTRLATPDCAPLPPETELYLDLSEPATPLLERIESRGVFTGEFTAGQETFQRPIAIGRMPPADLPDRWFGLESINVIIWDDPNPDRLQTVQLDALINWVKNGGKLVVGVGAAWPRIQKSALAEIMPIAGEEATIEVRSLPLFLEKLAAPDTREFRSPIGVCTARARERAVWMFRDQVDRQNAAGGIQKQTIDLISAWNVGSGQVIATAARLRDLTSVPPRVARDSAKPLLFHEIFELNPTSSAFQSSQAELINSSLVTPPELFTKITAPIEFRSIGSLMWVAAVAFVSAYIVLATLVSWWWLKRQAATHLSWSVFAGFSVAGSVFSLAAVSFTGGFSRVDSFSLVDLDSGSSAARGACFFGYRSAGRERPQLSLAGDHSYLRALARDRNQTSYATPLRYAALPGKSILENTPMRATLKQFEGYWTGTVNGSIRADLTADRASGRIAPESWIVNDLDVPIEGGYVLYVDPRLEPAVGRLVNKASGNTETYRRVRGAPAALNVLVAEVPPLKPTERKSGIGAREYQELDAKLIPTWEKNPKPETRPDLATLWHRHCAIMNELYPTLSQARFAVTGPDAAWPAAFMLSTRDLYLNTDRTDYRKASAPLNAENLVERDVTPWLLRGQAVLLLRCDRPGPAQLVRNGQALETSRGWSLYRVRVPLKLTGRGIAMPDDAAPTDKKPDPSPDPAENAP
ncbi:MAG: hypothetical protein U1D55_12345 [Phycisphaerae bacterium]